MNENTDPRLRHYEQKLDGLRQAIVWFLGMLMWVVVFVGIMWLIVANIIAFNRNMSYDPSPLPSNYQLPTE